MRVIRIPRNNHLGFPATASVELWAGLRYEGLWVEGRWRWTLWFRGTRLSAQPERHLGSDALN